MLADLRYALRSLRRSPLFAASVTATIGLGLGVLCSGFTILNAYILKPVDLPEPHSLYGLSWIRPPSADTGSDWTTSKRCATARRISRRSLPGPKRQ